MSRHPPPSLGLEARKQGTGVVRFRGRFGSKLLTPRKYRLVVMANTRTQKAPHKHASFKVVKG